MTKLEADNRLPYGKNSIFMKPEEELIETDCSKYEVQNSSSEEGSPTKADDFDEEF